MRKIIAIVLVSSMLFFGGGYFWGSKDPDCIVGYDDPAAKIYWSDGSMEIWFGGDFVLKPGESVSVPIEIPPSQQNDEADLNIPVPKPKI